MKTIIGIYKITCVITGKVYIGQSIDLDRRFSSYTRMSGSTYQVKLHRSRTKYGIESHSIEVIEECEIDKLNERERYWQDYYDSCGKNGLNCILTATNSKSGKASQETKDKISKALKGRKGKPLSKEHKELLSKINKGKKLSTETIEKIRKKSIGNKSRSGQKLKPHEIQKIKSRMIGNKYNLGRMASDETKTKMSISSKGKAKSESHKKAISDAKKRSGHHLARLVFNPNTGVYYMCAKDAAESIGMNYRKFHRQISGYCKNKTGMLYV